MYSLTLYVDFSIILLKIGKTPVLEYSTIQNQNILLIMSKQIQKIIEFNLQDECVISVCVF